MITVADLKDQTDVGMAALSVADSSNALCSREELWQLDADLLAKDQEMLHRLIDIRMSLWT